MPCHLLKTVLLVVCCLSVAHAEEHICRSKDKAGTTHYAPCGENPDPSTVVDTKITITTSPKSTTKPAAEKNPYFPDLKIDVKPPAKEKIPPPMEMTPESDEEAEAEDTEADAETDDDGTVVIPKATGRPGKQGKRPKPAANEE